MLDRLREFAGLAPRQGWCVAAMLELTGLGRVAEGTDTPHFVDFLKQAASKAVSAAEARGARAEILEAGTYLACFSADLCPEPGPSALAWALELGRTCRALAALFAGAVIPPHYAAALASGHGVVGRRGGGHVVTGDPVFVARRLLAAALPSESVFVDDVLASVLSPARHFEMIRARDGEKDFSAHRLVD
jgi:class 3 adenylate cyclase